MGVRAYLHIGFFSALHFDISHLAPLSVLCTLQTRAAAWVRGWVIPPVEVMDVLCCAAGAAHLQRPLNYLFGPQKSLMRMEICMYGTLGTGTVRSLLPSYPHQQTRLGRASAEYIHPYIRTCTVHTLNAKAKYGCVYLSGGGSVRKRGGP